MAALAYFTRGLAVFVLLTLSSPVASAWSNGGYSSDQSNPDYGTHDWIAEMALNLQTRDVTFLKTTYHSEFLLGTEAPDNSAFIGDSTKHHVYFYSSHQVQDDICAVKASSIYDIALGYILSGDYHSAAFDIGVMAHYISDPGVFGHTMGAYTDWGEEVHHQDYETKVESVITTLSQPTGLSLGDSDAYGATLDLGENVTFGTGSIKSNIWMDSNYNWADGIFYASALASLYKSVEAVAAVVNHLMIEASTAPPPPQVPQPPASLSTSVLDSRVVITWSPPSSNGGAEITGYKIYRGTDPDIPSYLAFVPGSVYSWSDESVEKGRTYYYWVTAENSAGSSNMSQVASAVIPKRTDSLTLPIALSGLAAVAVSAGVLIWRRRTRS